jgi:hypothetical protein
MSLGSIAILLIWRISEWNHHYQGSIGISAMTRGFGEASNGENWRGLPKLSQRAAKQPAPVWHAGLGASDDRNGQSPCICGPAVDSLL